eukprot:CAMPEP_0197703922 /NCGR_PEP_ID=MMETSP1338-20131121/125681_1 /TAXON_ID=43686 ORGANISM="Pelagodinium beii, Strain RCC1491" /NCGR_SAMPLE_ID=MMETSP1338 /ASSEMBLY_ACC=CAM_ASM_000754 /LENGTH=286 /DNA_ID=CAMNT_0043287821 /DNA_START=672 /DNA_END=1532 /DNA_ORIENTATION=+
MTPDFAALYFFTQYRFAPYIAGVSAGVAVAMDAKKSLPEQDAIVAATLKNMATACSYVVIALAWLNGGDFTNLVVPIKSLNAVVFLLLSSFLRPLLGLSVAWLLTSCTRGQAPLLNAFLSARVWSPIAGLSYSMYLLEAVGEKFSNWPFLAATQHLSKAIPVQLLRGYASMALYISAAMLLAILNFTLVERPGMLLGKRVISALKGLSQGRRLTRESSSKTSRKLDLEAAEPAAVVPSNDTPVPSTSPRTSEAINQSGQLSGPEQMQRLEEQSKTGQDVKLSLHRL